MPESRQTAFSSQTSKSHGRDSAPAGGHNSPPTGALARPERPHFIQIGGRLPVHLSPQVLSYGISIENLHLVYHCLRPHASGRSAGSYNRSGRRRLKSRVSRPPQRPQKGQDVISTLATWCRLQHNRRATPSVKEWITTAGTREVPPAMFRVRRHRDPRDPTRLQRCHEPQPHRRVRDGPAGSRPAPGSAVRVCRRRRLQASQVISRRDPEHPQQAWFPLTSACLLWRMLMRGLRQATRSIGLYPMVCKATGRFTVARTGNRDDMITSGLPE